MHLSQFRSLISSARWRSSAPRGAAVGRKVHFRPISRISAVLFCGVILAVAAPESPRVVKIQGMAYVPSTIELSTGESVVFENHDIFPHTVTSVKAGDFDSGIIAPGKSWTFKPSATGTTDFRCTFHPVMKGRLIVR